MKTASPHPNKPHPHRHHQQKRQSYNQQLKNLQQKHPHIQTSILKKLLRPYFPRRSQHRDGHDANDTDEEWGEGDDESSKGSHDDDTDASHDSNGTTDNDNDPPWRLEGHPWIGRRLLYFGCVDNVNDNEDDDDDGDGNAEKKTKRNEATNTIKSKRKGNEGTILAFLSKTDVDSHNQPAFISPLTHKPEHLFHVVFEDFIKDLEELDLLSEDCLFVNDADDDKEIFNGGGDGVHDSVHDGVHHDNNEEEEESEEESEGGSAVMDPIHPSEITIGMHVDIAPRTGPGINKPGGRAIVIGIVYGDHTDKCGGAGSRGVGDHAGDCRYEEKDSKNGGGGNEHGECGGGNGNNGRNDNSNESRTIIGVNVRYVLGGRERAVELKYVGKCVELGVRTSSSSASATGATSPTATGGCHVRGGYTYGGGSGHGAESGNGAKNESRTRGKIIGHRINASACTSPRKGNGKNDSVGAAVASSTSLPYRRTMSWRVMTLQQGKSVGGGNVVGGNVEDGGDDSWICKCGVKNASERKRCTLCRCGKVKQLQQQLQQKYQQRQHVSPKKDEEESWKCRKCGLDNNIEKKRCSECLSWKAFPCQKNSDNGGREGGGATNGVTIQRSEKNDATEGVGSEKKNGSWECRKCCFTNDPERQRCTDCKGWKNGIVPYKATTRNNDKNTSVSGNSHQSSNSSIGSGKRVTFNQDSVQTGQSRQRHNRNTNAAHSDDDNAMEDDLQNSSRKDREETIAIRKAGDSGNCNTSIVTPSSTASVQGKTPAKSIGNTKSLQSHSSFNEALKSALSSYASTAALRSSHAPPTPVPPPFLSHQEECTLRTALAFVMVQARKKNRQGSVGNEKSASSGTAQNDQGLNARAPGWTKVQANTSVICNLSLPSSAGRISGISALRVEGPRMAEHNERAPSLLGDILHIRSNSDQPINQQNSCRSNAKLMFDREIMHIRDILQLAVSSTLPLYKGALRRSEVLDRKPCAVYDYEAAVMSSQELNSASAPSLGSKAAKQHHDVVDGLCQHALVRLCRLINDRKMALKTTAKAKLVPFTNDEINNRNAIPSDANDKEGIKSHISEPNHEHYAVDIRRTIVKLFRDDLIAMTGMPPMSTVGDSLNDDGKLARECEERNIEKIMAGCHVLHRLLFFDKSCSFGTESVIAICSSLDDLYHDKYKLVLAEAFVKTNCNYNPISQASSISAFPSTSNPSNTGKVNAIGTNTVETMKGKTQVVSSRWNQSAPFYTKDRHERRRQAIDSMAQLFDGHANNDDPGPRGNKRNECCNELSPTSNDPLPSNGDVLAVNLLRLLEGAAAIRLHHRQRHCQLNRRGNLDLMMANAASTSATAILTEIRSSAGTDLTTPFHVDDVATFFYNENQARRDTYGQKSSLGNVHSDAIMLLRPGAKVMLRLHLFGLIKKLTLYEEA